MEWAQVAEEDGAEEEGLAVEWVLVVPVVEEDGDLEDQVVFASVPIVDTKSHTKEVYRAGK